MGNNNSVRSLSAEQLLEHCSDLVRRDRHGLAQLLVVLGEIDQRKIWAQKACPSMFVFCQTTFNMSESTAAKRIWAARIVAKSPVALPMIRRGELHLTGLHRLARHLTPANHREVLDQARNLSTRDIDLLVARIAPKPDVPARMRKVPSRVAGDSRSGDSAFVLEDGEPVRSSATPASAAAASGATTSAELRATPLTSTAASASNNRLTPLAPARFKLQPTVSAETRDQLQQLQDLRAHAAGADDLAAILAEAIDLLLTRTLHRKAALPTRVQADAKPARKTGTRAGAQPAAPSDSRHAPTPANSPGRDRNIPAGIRREVWLRDRGRCTFRADCGRRCEATRQIEYHHEIPFARGGQHKTEHISLRCRAHNQYQADLDFGAAFMSTRRSGAARKENTTSASTPIDAGGRCTAESGIPQL